MLYIIKDGVYFGHMPNRTQNSTAEWGFIFNDTECDYTLSNSTLVDEDKKASSEQIDEALIHVQHHIKVYLDKYDRMNEIFNLQLSSDDRNRVIRADPRRARTFLGISKMSLLPDMYSKVATIDTDFSQVENLITGDMDIFADPTLYLFNIKSVSPMVCYYTSGVLLTIDRLRLMQESMRNERITG